MSSAYAPTDANLAGARPRTRAGTNTWPAWVAQHRVGAAILAGVLATHITSLIGYWLPSIGLPRLDWNTTNGAILVPKSSAMTQFVVGGVYHTMTGIFFALVFALLIHPLLPGAGTARNNIIRGLAFGTLLAFVSTLWMIPQVYFPSAHAGFMSFNLGWKLVLAVFVWHWVYGLHLGAFYNPEPLEEEA